MSKSRIQLELEDYQRAVRARDDTAIKRQKQIKDLKYKLQQSNQTVLQQRRDLERMNRAEMNQKFLQEEINSLKKSLENARRDFAVVGEVLSQPVPMLLWCPLCGTRHIDKGEFATKSHHTHACQSPTCGFVWRPAVKATVGVQHLPGFKDES